MALRFILGFSENPDKMLYHIHSPADVDHLIGERIEYAKSQQVKNLKTKDPMSISVIQTHRIMNL